MITLKDLEDHLNNRVKEIGGKCQKLRWVSCKGGPTRFVMLSDGAYWVELIEPGKQIEPNQERAYKNMRAMGQIVLALRSIESIDAWFSC